MDEKISIDKELLKDAITYIGSINDLFNDIVKDDVENGYEVSDEFKVLQVEYTELYDRLVELL